MDVPSRAPAFTVAGVLARYYEPFQRQHGHQFSSYVHRVLEQLIDCGTPQAGNHAWFCRACGHPCAAYNACHNRHCNCCGVAKRMAWLEQVKSWTLPCIYWHIVFTLPHEFNDLIEANRELFYNLIFECSNQTLLRSAKQYGFLPSIIGSLHSWGQRMLAHVHTHLVMSCGGLALDGTKWIDIDPDDPRFDRTQLSKLYRHLFLKRLRRLFNQGKLVIPPTMPSLPTMKDLLAWLEPIAAKPWNVNVQKPPAGCDGPATAIGYLGRYVAGTAIKDCRILHDDGRNVTLRIKNYRHGGAEESIRISGTEFVRRYATHIVPPYCRRVRYAGLLGQSKRKDLLPRCRELLADRIRPTLTASSSDTAPCTDVFTETEEEKPQPPRACHRCRGTDFVLIESFSPEIDYSYLLAPCVSDSVVSHEVHETELVSLPP